MKRISHSEMTAFSATEAAGAIRTGQVTAVEYAEALIEQADRLSSLNAFITFDGDRIRHDARAIDNQIADGVDVGPLAGVPVAVKDNIHTDGVRTTAGTFVLRGFVPDAHAEVLNRLFAAGALLGGKTNMHELGHMPSGRNPTYGNVQNPRDVFRTSGGSSAGTAAAVAAQILPIGLGSDTGGSCRIPAALCGCFGFRPTIGRYSQAGQVMLSHTHDTVGLIARSIADIEILDRLCTSESPSGSGIKLSETRIGIPRSFFDSLDAQLAEVVQGALDTLRASGVILVEDDIPNLAQLTSAASVILAYEIPRDLDRFLQDNGLMPLDLFVDGLRDTATKSQLQQLVQNRIPEPVYRQGLGTHRPALQA
ncbi:MAG: amidase family protein [Planctomycetota bacterium]